MKIFYNKTNSREVTTAKIDVARMARAPCAKRVTPDELSVAVRDPDPGSELPPEDDEPVGNFIVQSILAPSKLSVRRRI